MTFKRYKHLNVPDSWERYFTKYPQGMSILESLFEWVSQVDSMVDNQNKLSANVEQFRIEIDEFVGRFDERLQTEVTQTLNEWQNSGFLDVVISSALQWELDNYIATNEQDKVSITTQLQQTEQELNAQLAHIERLNYNKVSITQFNIPLNKDITSIINSLDDNKTLVLDDEYFVSNPITLKNKLITGGKLTYIGERETPYFIRVHQNGGVYDMQIHVATTFFGGNIILVDYDDNPVQYVIKDKYILNHLAITNSEATEIVQGAVTKGNVVPGSSVIKIELRKSKVVAYQNIENIKFDGVCDYGIHIEIEHEIESDNGVYNTSTFKDIAFTTVNCAIKVYPKMLTGLAENSSGMVELELLNFSNQFRKGIVTKPFMDILNTIITGSMVIPWDYKKGAMSADGIYKTKNSTVLINYDRFPDTENTNPDVFFSLAERSTGERYTNINVIQAEDVQDRKPLRKSGIGWGLDNIKNVVFTPPLETNPYGTRYIGLELQQSNANDSQNRTWQIGMGYSGTIVKRQYDSVNNKWKELQRIYSHGNMPVMSKTRRASGVGVGDMMFDTSNNKPYWWNGTEWVDSQGINEFEIDY